MRTTLTLALLFAAGRLQAQGYVGGFVLDSATKTPLPCIQVTLLDTAGHAVVRQLTMPDGAFQFDAPPRGTYRLAFFLWHHEPLVTEGMELEPTMERARQYTLNFRREPVAQRYADTALYAPAVPVMNSARPPRFPDALRARGVYEISATFDLLVDSTGSPVPSSVKISDSPNPSYAKDLERFLKAVKFTPARFDGRPVCALIRNERLITRTGPVTR